MDNKARFDQIEQLLVNLIQKVDRQEQFNARQAQFNTRQAQFNTRQEQFNASQEQFNARQEQHNARTSEQIDDIINILKLSAQATKEAEARQDQLLREIREQGRRTDATQAEVLRMMDKWTAQDTRNEATEARLSSHEPRIQRLEDETFRQAS